MSSFSGEYLKRPVVDANGDLFGHLVDIVIEPRSGEIAEILVDVVSEIDVTKLPWPTEDGLCQVPAQEIAQIGSRIMLRR
ncbi:MAG: PRC-barrel domain containing protein [Candidatus Poseidoniales archaeon]|nr:MAG: PRC-barrel domain containing protein [Candidatus Poseidoniales archaeon]